MNRAEFERLLVKRPELAALMEYVSPSRRFLEGFYRLKPASRNKTVNELKRQLKMSEASYRLYDEKLDMETFWRKVGDELRGRGRDALRFEKTIEKLEKALKAMQVVAERRRVRIVEATA